MKRKAATAAALLAILALAWLATTDDVRVWPARNVLQYRLVKWWWALAGPPARGQPGALWGIVRNQVGEPVAGARVLVARWDGETFRGTSDAGGAYTIEGVPAGRYLPVAGAPGYEDTVVGAGPPPWWPWQGVIVRAGERTRADVTLRAQRQVPLTPGRHLALSPPAVAGCERPIRSQAARRQVTFDSAGRPNQPTFLYTPAPDAAALRPELQPEQPGGGQQASLPAPAHTPAPAPSAWPVLLTVYPGPVESWECVSVPLAASGYAVIATGPAYSFDLERDVDELARSLQFARAGQLPGANGERAALLGGSYSALHVQRLLQRDPRVAAAVLLGAPADLFDMRRRLEEGTFIPPFGLDRALIALGFPDRQPWRYWRYSGAYHLRPDLPPVLLVHSRRDEVVPFQQSELLAGELAAAGVAHELHLFEGASHYLLSEEADALAIYHLTLAFLARHLGPPERDASSRHTA